MGQTQGAAPHLAVKDSWKEYIKSLFLYNVALLKHADTEEIPARQLNFVTAAVLAKSLKE